MYICVPIKSKDFSKVLILMKTASKAADMLEIWFDEIADLNYERFSKIVRASTRPLIFKVSNINGDNYRLISANSFSGIQYLDLDINTGQEIRSIKNSNPKLKIIISCHDFKKTPEFKKLNNLAIKMLEMGADIIKIATTARNKEDSLKMLSFLSNLTGGGKQAICLCMGKLGQLTRTSGHLFGNYLMYAPISAAHKTAPGQITIRELSKILKRCH